jgi:hypothetical protein
LPTPLRRLSINLLYGRAGLGDNFRGDMPAILFAVKPFSCCYHCLFGSQEIADGPMVRGFEGEDEIDLWRELLYEEYEYMRARVSEDQIVRAIQPAFIFINLLVLFCSLVATVVYWPGSSGRPNPCTYIHSQDLKLEPVHPYDWFTSTFEDGPAFCSPCIAAHGGKEKAPFSLGKFHLYLDRLSCRRLSRGGLVSPYKTRSGYDASCQ